MGYQKITNLLDTTINEYLDLLLKNGQKYIISQVVPMIDINQIKNKI